MATERSEPVAAAALAAAAAQADRSAALAVLADDSPLPGATAPLSRRLSYRAPSLGLVLDVVWDGSAYSGELRMVPGRAVEVTVHTGVAAPQTLSGPVALGADGGAIGALPVGPCKLTLVSSEETVETEWVTLLRPEPRP